MMVCWEAVDQATFPAEQLWWWEGVSDRSGEKRSHKVTAHQDGKVLHEVDG